MEEEGEAKENGRAGAGARAAGAVPVYGVDKTQKMESERREEGCKRARAGRNRNRGEGRGVVASREVVRHWKPGPLET